MRIILWLALTSLVWAAPGGCHGSGSRGFGGYHRGSYYGYGYGRRARGPALPFAGGSPPGYNSEEQRAFPRLFSNQPAGTLAPFSPQPFDPTRAQVSGNNRYQITHAQDHAPPGY